MNETKIEVKNYKLLKEGEYNLSGGSIFLMSGPNNVGKTSFLHLLQSIMEVKDDTINPVTHGEKEGFATGTIIGADGEPYQFRYDFNVDGRKKFTFIGPDGKQLKTMGEMRAIFNYTHFTLEEFFNWSKSEVGRKKQRDIIMKLLDEKEQDEINQIEAKINTRNGVLYIERQNINRDVESLNSVVSNTILSDEQKTLLKQAKTINEEYNKLVKRKEEIEKLIQVDPEVVQKIATSKANKSTAEKSITTSNDEIERLKKLIAIEERNIKDQEAIVNLEVKVIEELSSKSDGSIDIDALTIELNGDGTEKNPGIINRIAKGQEIKNKLAVAEELEKNREIKKQEALTKQAKADELSNNIETLRARKQAIIKGCAGIPESISIDDDYITIDGIPFTEEDVSKSKATKAIARLMMLVNKAPIMLMGDAESLGYEVLNELKEEAEAMGKTMVFAEHVRYLDELTLVCFDELDQEGATDKAKDTKPNNEQSKLF